MLESLVNKRETPVQVFSYKSCESFKTSILKKMYERLLLNKLHVIFKFYDYLEFFQICGCASLVATLIQ